MTAYADTAACFRASDATAKHPGARWLAPCSIHPSAPLSLTPCRRARCFRVVAVGPSRPMVSPEAFSFSHPSRVKLTPRDVVALAGLPEQLIRLGFPLSLSLAGITSAKTRPIMTPNRSIRRSFRCVNKSTGERQGVAYRNQELGNVCHGCA